MKRHQKICSKLKLDLAWISQMGGMRKFSKLKLDLACQEPAKKNSKLELDLGYEDTTKNLF